MRSDGKRVHMEDPLEELAPYFMKHRYDAMNMVEEDIPLEPIRKYLNAKRADGVALTHLDVITAAYVRIASEFEFLNRFIMSGRIYQRNDFSVSMVVLKPGEKEAMNKMFFRMEDTIFDVHDTIDRYISENRQPGVQNATDKVMKFLLAVPGVASLAISLLMAADRLGLLPKSLLNASPFHNSLCITNLASIRTNSIFHHCYDFGTTSIFISIGKTKDIPKQTQDGIVLERCIPLGIVMDERICGGVHFAKACARMRRYLQDPRLLEVPPETVNTKLG